MQTALEEEMNLKEDQVVIVDLGPNEDTARLATDIIGPKLPEPASGVVVV
jgi:hypothetical protein